MMLLYGYVTTYDYVYSKPLHASVSLDSMELYKSGIITIIIIIPVCRYIWVLYVGKVYFAECIISNTCNLQNSSCKKHMWNKAYFAEWKSRKLYFHRLLVEYNAQLVMPTSVVDYLS